MTKNIPLVTRRLDRRVWSRSGDVRRCASGLSLDSPVKPANDDVL